MRWRFERAVILANLTVLVLVAAGCGVHDRVVLTGRVVSVHAPLRTVYLLDDGNVVALVVDPVATRIVRAGGVPVSIAEIRPGVEIWASGRRSGVHYVRVEEIRLHATESEVPFRDEDRANRPSLRERPAPPLRRDGTRGLGVDRGTGAPRTRRDAVRERGQYDFRHTGALLRSRTAAGRMHRAGPRPHHDPTRFGLFAGRGIRSHSQSRRLSAVSPGTARGHAYPHHAARPPRPAGGPAPGTPLPGPSARLGEPRAASPSPRGNWVATIHHGIPVEHYRLRTRPGDYLAFLGRISIEKRLDRAIEIARAVDMPLKVAAKIDIADRDYYEYAIEPLLDHPLVEYIGEVDEAGKDEFLGNAYAHLFPIDWPEPFGLTMIEAMATGTPVIAMACGSVPEVVESGVTGFVCQSLDEMVAAVRRIPEISRQACRRHVEERFSARRMAEDYEAVYDRCLADRYIPQREPVMV